MPKSVPGREPHARKRTRNGGAVVERKGSQQASTFSPQEDDLGFTFLRSFLEMYGPGEM